MADSRDLGPTGTGRVLVVDDDADVRDILSAHLEDAGYAVVAVEDGAPALEAIDTEPFDVILTDIGMPGMSGIEFLRRVRARDLDVPVLLITGDPRLETAIEAVEYGAARYMVKPVSAQRVLDEVARALRLRGLARLKREALRVAGLPWSQLGDKAALEARFENALETLWPAFQPIVAWKEQRIYGYEALVRSDEPTLPTPEELLEVAERLGRSRELGRVLRTRIAAAAEVLPDGVVLFVNLGPDDLLDEDLLARDAPLHPFARRVVLEITERAPLGNLSQISSHVSQLRRYGYRFAVDDLGAGYAGLSSLLQLDPEVVKLDMGLVRGIDQDLARQRVIGSMVKLCKDLRMETVIEGVQTVRAPRPDLPPTRPAPPSRHVSGRRRRISPTRPGSAATRPRARGWRASGTARGRPSGPSAPRGPAGPPCPASCPCWHTTR
jgi:EAL domain-containing protein (putative c-di-GMP-specific phosphodiesterase class I)/CheY-like chemotaxis protein